MNQPNKVIIADNLQYLKKMQTLNHLFDVIYIDPPYNTQNKFSYNDNHENWQDFMLQRLQLTAPIMQESGVIFISIDDNSLCELKIACDKIFGKDNFVGIFITKQAMRSNSKHINTIHEYIIVYAKNKYKLPHFRIKRLENPEDAAIIQDLSAKIKQKFNVDGKKSAEKLLFALIAEYIAKTGKTWLRNYSAVDDSHNKGEIFFPKDLSVPGEPAPLEIAEIGLNLPALATRKWSTPQKFIKLHNENRLYFKGNRPYEKHYLKESCDNVSSILDFYSRQGTNDLKKLGLSNLFDTPKPVELIKYLIRIATQNKANASILDYFAGSGTTGQAVMEINLQDGKNHNFCLVQLDEPIKKGTKQYKFAVDNAISPTIDQLMIHRLNIAKEKLGYMGNFEILKS